MPTLAKNRIVRSISPNQIFPELALGKGIDSTISWNQGDLCYFDDVANLVKPLGSDANALKVLGIAIQSIVNGKPVSPYQGTAVDAAQALEPISGPQFGVVAKMKLKVGDAFAFGDLVFYGGDAQTVSSVGTNLVGIYQGKALTAASGDEGEVLLVAFPTAAI